MQGEWRPIPQVNKDTGIPALTTPEFLTKRSYSWILCAMANFYGALTVQQAFRIIEQQNPGLTTQDEVSAVLHREEDDAAYCEEFDGEEVVCEEWFLEQPEEYRGMASARQGKPIYIPPKDELLRYEDELYFENTPATQAMRDFFKTELGVARETLSDDAAPA